MLRAETAAGLSKLLAAPAAPPRDPDQLHRDILGCTRCVDAGFLPLAAPVLSGYPDNQIMLIGQAPGAVEAERRLPFQGRSGKVLMQWLARAGDIHPRSPLA